MTRTFALASPQLPHMTNERLSISQNYRQNLWTGHTVSRVFQNIFCTSRVLKFSPRKVKFFTHFSARTTVRLVLLRIQTFLFHAFLVSNLQFLGYIERATSLSSFGNIQESRPFRGSSLKISRKFFENFHGSSAKISRKFSENFAEVL